MGKIAAIPIALDSFPGNFTYVLIKGGFESRALKTIRESMRAKGWEDDIYTVFDAGDKIVNELKSEGIDAMHVADISIATIIVKV
jgi:hypothetical protein